MTPKRQWLGPSVYWWQPRPSDKVSAEDVICLLGRGTPRRGRTLLQNLRTLPPGHRLPNALSDSHPKRTWRPEPASTQVDLKTLVLATRQAVEESVVAAVPRRGKLAVMLSGGLDSTIVAAVLAAAEVPFTCLVAENEGLGGPKEARYAIQVAEKLGVPIQRVAVNATHLDRAIQYMEARYPVPSICWVIANQLALSESAASQGIDTLMLGLGSDEVFGGYHKIGRYGWRFREEERAVGTDRAWQTLLGPRSKRRTELLYIGQCCPIRRRALGGIFADHDVTAILEDDVVELFRELRDFDPHISYSAAIMQLEMELRTSDILVAELAAISGASGVSIVCPFLDRRVLNVAVSIPIEHRYRYEKLGALKHRPTTHAVEKYVLRLAFQDVVPPFVQTRPRMTYTYPFARVLQDSKTRRAMQEEILQSALVGRIGASRSALREVLRSRITGNPWAGPFRFWTLLRLARWLEHGGPSRLAAMASGDHVQLIQSR
jgi:asparagine synthetase B (glutamine-hydrolysing)